MSCLVVCISRESPDSKLLFPILVLKSRIFWNSTSLAYNNYLVKFLSLFPWEKVPVLEWWKGLIPWQCLKDPHYLSLFKLALPILMLQLGSWFVWGRNCHWWKIFLCCLQLIRHVKSFQWSRLLFLIPLGLIYYNTASIN